MIEANDDVEFGDVEVLERARTRLVRAAPGERPASRDIALR
jgi:hypothetical protein